MNPLKNGSTLKMFSFKPSGTLLKLRANSKVTPLKKSPRNRIRVCGFTELSTNVWFGKSKVLMARDSSALICELANSQSWTHQQTSGQRQICAHFNIQRLGQYGRGSSFLIHIYCAQSICCYLQLPIVFHFCNNCIFSSLALGSGRSECEELMKKNTRKVWKLQRRKSLS